MYKELRKLRGNNKPEFHGPHKNPFERLIEGIDNSVKKIKETAKDVVNEGKQLLDTASKTATAIGEGRVNIAKGKSLDNIVSDFKETIKSSDSKEAAMKVITHQFPTPAKEKKELTPPVTPNVEPTYIYVGDILVDDTISFNPNCFNKIYVQVPDSLCESYNKILERFRIQYPKGDAAAMTYEEILKFHMDLAADASELARVDVIIELVSFFTGISIPIPSPQTFALSLIWASMIYDLEAKKSSAPDGEEKNKIAKTCIGLLGFASQIFHRETPLWRWIATIYKSFAMAGDYIKESPYLYRKLFPHKNIDIKRFPNWHKELEKHVDRDDKVSIGQAFNICYTFRVGDIYLHSVLNTSSYFNDELKQRLIDSLSPMPRERDLMRIFDLYTKPYIY